MMAGVPVMSRECRQWFSELWSYCRSSVRSPKLALTVVVSSKVAEDPATNSDIEDGGGGSFNMHICHIYVSYICIRKCYGGEEETAKHGRGMGWGGSNIYLHTFMEKM